MKLEHFALNVEDPAAMAKWYVLNLGMRIVKQLEAAPFTTFMADDSGKMMIEIYKNSIVVVPEYRKMNPLMLHIAFVSEDPDADKKRLVAAGASFETETRLEDGTHLVMLRDPWGIAVQLCKRAEQLTI